MYVSIVLAIGLTAAIYGVRQYLRQPLPSLSRAAQNSLLVETEFTGTIQPATEFKIAAPTPAVVQQVLVQEGDQVEFDQPLMVLENLDLRQDFEQAKQQQALASQQVQQLERQIASFHQVAVLNAQMAEAEASLSKAQLESQQVPLPQRQDSIARAQATYDLALAQFERMSRLYQAGALAKADLEGYGADLKVAEADLISARQANSASQGVMQEQNYQGLIRQELTVAQQNQQIAEMQGQLEAAQLQYEQWTSRLEQLQQQWGSTSGEGEVGHLVIRATQAGVVTHLPVTVGDQIFSGTALIEFAQLDKLDVVVPVDVRLINTLRLNQRAVVELGTVNNTQQFEARVLAIQPIPNEDLTHSVKVQFQNPDQYLLVKQPAKVHFLSE